MAESPLDENEGCLLCCLSGGHGDGRVPPAATSGVTWLALFQCFRAARKSRNQAFYLGYIAGLVHYLTTLYWIRYRYVTSTGPSTGAGLSGLVLLCGYLALYPACFALLPPTWKNHPRLWCGCSLPDGVSGMDSRLCRDRFPLANWVILNSLSPSHPGGRHQPRVRVSWLLVLANTCIGRA